MTKRAGDTGKFALTGLEVRNSAGQIVTSFEFEELQPRHRGGCRNGPYDGFYWLHCPGTVEVPINVPVAGNHVIDIVAWGDQAGDEFPKLSVVVESDAEDSAGSATIRNKLVELHDKLLGVQVMPDSPDVEAAYRLFVDVWEHKREAQGDWSNPFRCGWWRDIHFFEDILDDVVVEREEDGYRRHELDWDRVKGFLDGIDFSDPSYTAQAWMVVLAALMMDYRYLYL